MDAAQLLKSSVAAYQAKEFVEAERLLHAALNAANLTSGIRRTTCIYLGMGYQKAGRDEEAVPMLESGLPFPAAFQELVKLYRRTAKNTKVGDKMGAAEWYRRMFCLSRIHSTVMTLRVPNVPVAVDWDVAANWLHELRCRFGTLYPYRFEGIEVPGDTLLTPADYKGMRESTEGAG